MAGTEKKKKSGANEPSLIDPVYQKFTKAVLRSLGSNEFYQFFMNAIACADNEIQFSNRKEVKYVDEVWIDACEDALEAFQTIVSLPRIEIRDDEFVVNVANARKTGPDVVQNLARHASYVEDFNADSGDVRPSKLMQRYREEDIATYENRLVFTALESAYHFVRIRHDALFEAMSDEFGAKLKLRSDMSSATEKVHMDMFLHIKNTESMLETDEKNRAVFDRISRLYRVLGVFMNADFSKEMAKYNRVKGPIHKTNVLKKNPNYRAVVKLLEFLRSYDQIGYTIQVVEQNPEVDETFQRDIFHNILFNYIVLKGYLEDEQDRKVPVARKPKQRKLKPKFIRQIIEELTEDYDLPDVEIRKVLIEELTKEQLMQEEENERLRLVEEQDARRREEEEQKQRERQAAEERRQLEREAEERRLEEERQAREAEEKRRSALIRREVEAFRVALGDQLQLREDRRSAIEQEKQDFADAVELLEEAERLKSEEEARERRRKQDELERQRREAELAAEAARLEQERLEAERQAELARQEAERQAELARLRAEEIRQTREQLPRLMAELGFFRENLVNQRSARVRQRAAAEEASAGSRLQRQQRVTRS